MHKSDLIEHIAKAVELSKADAERTVNAVLDAITNALKKGDQIVLTGFGSFKVTARKARTGRNPRTGEEIKIPAGKKVSFSPSKTLKDEVNG